MRVYKTGQDHPAIEVEKFGRSGLLQPFDLPGRPDGGDNAVAQQDRTLVENTQVGKSAAAARRAAGRRHDLRGSANQKGGAHSRTIMLEIADWT